MEWKKQNKFKSQFVNGVTSFFKYVFLLILAMAIGVVCLVGAYMIPLSDQTDNVLESVRILEEEGWYPVIPFIQKFTGVYGTYQESPGILDNYTDELMIQTSALNPEGNYLHTAMIPSYPRYWGGFVAVLRPVLCVFDYGEIRMLNILFQMLLIAILSMQIYKRKGQIWCFWVLSIYALMTPYVLGLSLQNSCIFYISVFGTIIYLWKESFFEKNNRYLYLFFVLGILTAYFDFLTYPLFVWAFPLTVKIVISRQKRFCEYFKDILFTGICWAFGYAGMWAGKWIIAGMVLHMDISEILLERIELHSIYGGTDISFIENLSRNIEKWINSQTLCVLFIWFVWFWVMSVKRKGVLSIGKGIPFSIISCGSFAWYYVMRYHTHMHAFFTHRLLSITFCAVLAACICMIEEKQDEHVTSQKAGRIVTIAVFFLSVFITMQCKTEIGTHNGSVLPSNILLEEGDFITETIVPEHKYMKDFGVGLIADKGEGEYLIEIYEGNNLLAEKIIPFSETTEGGIFTIPIERNIKEKELTVCITTQKNKDANGYVYIAEGTYSIPGCSEALLNDSSLGGQLTQWINYIALPGKKECLNYFLIIVGIFMLLFTDGYYMVNLKGIRL